MFLAVSLLLLGVGMVSNNPLKQQPEGQEGIILRGEPECEKITDLNDSWKKYINNICYNCWCLEVGLASCRKPENRYCLPPTSCPDLVIPPKEECKCPYCRHVTRKITAPTKPITMTIIETEGTPTTEYNL